MLEVACKIYEKIINLNKSTKEKCSKLEYCLAYFRKFEEEEYKVKRPIIGITGSIMFDQGGAFPGYKRAYANNTYVEAVSNAGGIPIILPIISDKDAVKLQIESIDGLLITGGYDVDPLIYGEEPLQKLGFVHPERDEYDIQVIKEAMKLNKPVLGICRGLQVLNVAFGGTLYQDLSQIDGCYINHSQSSSSDATGHTVEVFDGTKLFSIFGEKAVVNSFHHQAIKDLAPGLKVSARAKDGVIEGIEAKEGFVIGVQWHPEMLAKKHTEMLKIFEELIKQSSQG